MARWHDMTAQELIAFETSVKDGWEAGDLPCLLHLCGGNEWQLLNIFRKINQTSKDWIFSTHRNHYHALMTGIPADAMTDRIRDGRSMFVYSREHNFFCSAVLAGTCGIAAGVAWQLKAESLRNTGTQEKNSEKGKRDSCVPAFLSNPSVLCFIGDGGEEQGHFYEAAMFVEANELPCTFIIEDNNRSVDTPRDVRRGNAKGLEHLFKCVKRYQYEPTYPHAGSGCQFQITFRPEAIDRMNPTKRPSGDIPVSDPFRRVTGQ